LCEGTGKDNGFGWNLHFVEVVRLKIADSKVVWDSGFLTLTDTMTIWDPTTMTGTVLV
jgi:hypothetical protein